MKIELLYEDEDLLIVNKPSGLLVIPDRFQTELPSLNRMLKEQVWVVHRLDRETSGVICFARNAAMHRYLSALFMEHKVEKRYVGLVSGNVHPPEGSIDAPIARHPSIGGKMVVAAKGKPSHTSYRLLKQWPLYALLEYQLHTGRTHQIRVHSAHIGHAIVGDELYGNGKPLMLSQIKRRYQPPATEEERPLLRRTGLHASLLRFVKPDGKEITAEAPLPKDLRACVQQLDKWSPSL